MVLRRRSFAFAAVAILLAVGVVQIVHTIRVRAYGGVAPVCRVRTNSLSVALSVDDGPDPRYTPQVLDILEANHSKATFFMIGERADARPSLVRAVVASGSEIGNHTWSHPHLIAVPETTAMREISRTTQELSTFGVVRFLRMPYGEARAETFAEVRQGGLIPIHWSLPLDHYVVGLGLPPADAVREIAEEVSSGDIILAHDADDGGISRAAAIETLWLLLPRLRADGYRVVSVGELLKNGQPVQASPRPWFWQSGFTCPSG
jgi:peptidoglycan/xylan/chitin deacetylase (PgdA/CDA1 family)